MGLAQEYGLVLGYLALSLAMLLLFYYCRIF